MLEATILPLLSPELAAIIRQIPCETLNRVAEIRLRAERPLLIVCGSGDSYLNRKGLPVTDPASAYICSREDLARTLQIISRNSVYAFEQEFKQGFFTVAGGHRIGLAGQAIISDGELKALKNIGAMNIRLAREFKGAASLLMPFVVDERKLVLSTLIIGPPCSGKTTLLRDLIRQLSTGAATLNFAGVQIGLVDERSEIAACKEGVPSADIGPRTDVMDGCPKATGMLMLIRSMAPRVVATDELGREEDAMAVREALHAGVSVITSVHGRDHNDIAIRPFIGELVRQKLFDRYIIISDKPSVGTIDAIIDVKSEIVLSCRKKGVRVCG